MPPSEWFPGSRSSLDVKQLFCCGSEKWLFNYNKYIFTNIHPSTVNDFIKVKTQWQNGRDWSLTDYTSAVHYINGLGCTLFSLVFKENSFNKWQGLNLNGFALGIFDNAAAKQTENPQHLHLNTYISVFITQKKLHICIALGLLFIYEQKMYMTFMLYK